MKREREREGVGEWKTTMTALTSKLLKIQGVVAHSTDRTTVTLSGNFFLLSSFTSGSDSTFCSGFFLPNPNMYDRVVLLGDAIATRKLLRNASVLLSSTATTTTKAKSRRIAIDGTSYSVEYAAIMSLFDHRLRD